MCSSDLSGNLDLRVRMSRGATGAQVVAVGRTAYAGFRSSLSDHETDLEVAVGDDEVHVRGFEPEADVAAVADELEVATSAFPRGRVRVDLNTQRVPAGRRLTDTIDVRLPAGSTSADLRPALAGLRASYADDPQRGWGVGAADGSGLHPDLGFPSAGLVAEQAALTALGGPLARRAGIGVDLVERRGHGFEGLTTTTVTGRSGALDLSDPEVRDEVIAFGERQLDALPAGFLYTLVVDGRDTADIDASTCSVDGGRIQRALARHQFGLDATQSCPG